MIQLDLPFDTGVDTPEVKSPQYSPVTSQTETTQESANKLLDTYNYTYQYGDYKSYRIWLEKEKISKIYFSFWNHKFLVYLDEYSFTSEKLSVNNYYETDPSEREVTFSTQVLKNITIQGIQKKDPVWYGWFQKNVNYFKFLGMKHPELKKFLERLLKKYHNV